MPSSCLAVVTSNHFMLEGLLLHLSWGVIKKTQPLRILEREERDGSEVHAKSL